jgi:hypothetical protein
MKWIATRVSLVGAALLYAASPAAAQAWPVGIPAAPFGTTEIGGAATYYIDSTNAAATDTSNPNGTATRPRRTVPTSFPAGAVVEIRGGPYATGAGIQWTGSGTQAAPVIIRGVGSPVFNGGGLGFTGNYFIIDGIVMEGMQVSLDGSHIALRNSVVRNYNPGRHSTTVSPQGSYLVFYRNQIYNNGDSSGTAEADVHGIKPSSGDSFIWIIGNEIHHNGGDSVQIGDATTAEPWPHHIYVGGNTMHEDRENAVDIKQARDIIVSSNTMYGYKPSSSSNGETTVTHNNPQRVWFINNFVRNSHTGIVCTGADQYYVIGNVITDIIHTGTSYDPGSLYNSQAILVYASTNAYAISNTIWNVDAGISNATGSTKMEFVDNIIGNLLQPSHHIAVSNTTAANASVMKNNLFSGTVRIRWGESATSSLVDCQNCKTGDPLFVNAALRDLRITALSPAVNSGIAHAVYTTFQSLYGESIARDPGGLPKPTGGWDIGAYEAGSGSTVPAPSSPANVRIIR